MLTVGILTYTLNSHLADLTKKAIETFSSQVDELIVVENGGSGYWSGDVVVSYRENHGYTRGVNTILHLAKEPYVCFVSNDIELRSGDLKSLCIPNTVTSPEIFPCSNSGFSGAMFCIPQTVLYQVGFFNESMKLRWSDVEFEERLRSKGIPIKQIPGVEVFHHLDQTSHLTDPLAEHDKEAYENIRHHS